MTLYCCVTSSGVTKLTDDEVVAQSVVSLVAGHDTSSNTLSFLAYYLALYHHIQHKLRREITDAIESNPTGTLYDIIQNLEYMQCVISEAQRLNPASPVKVLNRTQSMAFIFLLEWKYLFLYMHCIMIQICGWIRKRLILRGN